MKKKIPKILCAVLALCCSFGVAASDVLTTLAVKPSQVNYDIQVYDETEIGVYICNKTKVKNVGDEVYLTYTVDEVGKRNTAMQHGVIATDTYSFSWPYEQGGVLRYDDRMQLLDEGYTYFFKFVYTGNGKFDVTAGRAKDSISEYIGFVGSYGDATDDYAYFGVWFSSGVSEFQLSHVRCYDKYGNDLGINVSRKGRATEDVVLKNNKEVNHSYSVKVSECGNVALSNARRWLTDVAYIEYTVKSDSSEIIQSGAGCTLAPLSAYPHENGYLCVTASEKPEQSYILQPGASYIFRLTKKEEYLDVLVQRTYQGKTERYAFDFPFGTYYRDADYGYLWFGEGDCKAAFELEDFKFYDETGKNLAVQCNQAAVTTIRHHGEIDDYAGCEALYYNEAEESFIALYADKRAVLTKGDNTTQALYTVKEDVLTIQSGDTVQNCKYNYQYIELDNGTIYKRLGTYKATFVTNEGETVTEVNSDTGFKVEKPEEPEKKGAKFEGWYLADGTEYDFDTFLTKSVTLYARFDDPNAFEVLGGVVTKSAFVIVAGALILIIGILVSGVIVKRGRKIDEN